MTHSGPEGSKGNFIGPGRVLLSTVWRLEPRERGYACCFPWWHSHLHSPQQEEVLRLPWCAPILARVLRCLHA